MPGSLAAVLALVWTSAAPLGAAGRLAQRTGTRR